MSNEDRAETTEKHLERAKAILDGPDTEERQALLALLSKPAKKDAVVIEPDSPVATDGPDKAIQTDVATASTDALKPRTTIMGRDFEDVRWATEGDYKGQPWLAPVGDYRPGFQQDVIVKDPELSRQISGIIEKKGRMPYNPMTSPIKIDGTQFDYRFQTYKESSIRFLMITVIFTDPKDQKKYGATLVLKPATEMGSSYKDKIPGYKDGDYAEIKGWEMRKMHPDEPLKYAMDDEDNSSKLTTPERIKLLDGLTLDKLLAEINQRIND